MIADIFIIIYVGILLIFNTLLTGVSALIPTEVNTEVITVIEEIGSKVNSIYNIIPAAESLWTIILTIFTIMIGYLGVRITVFIFNKIRGSGGNI